MSPRFSVKSCHYDNCCTPIDVTRNNNIWKPDGTLALLCVWFWACYSCWLHFDVTSASFVFPIISSRRQLILLQTRNDTFGLRKTDGAVNFVVSLTLTLLFVLDEFRHPHFVNFNIMPTTKCDCMCACLIGAGLWKTDGTLIVSYTIDFERAFGVQCHFM